MAGIINNGQMLKIEFDNHLSELAIVACVEKIMNGQKYLEYHFTTGHILYVKDTFLIPERLNVKGHLIDSTKEIQNDDYYLKIYSKAALPL